MTDHRYSLVWYTGEGHCVRHEITDLTSLKIGEKITSLLRDIEAYPRRWIYDPSHPYIEIQHMHPNYPTEEEREKEYERISLLCGTYVVEYLKCRHCGHLNALESGWRSKGDADDSHYVTCSECRRVSFINNQDHDSPYLIRNHIQRAD